MRVASGKGDGEPPALISESTCDGMAQGAPGLPFSSRVNSPFIRPIAHFFHREAIPRVYRARIRIPIHLFSHAVTCHLKAWTPTFDSDSGITNSRNPRGLAPTRRALPINQFLKISESPILASAQLKDSLLRSRRRSSLFATSIRVAPRAILRSSHCYANCPDGEVPRADSKSSALSPRRTDKPGWGRKRFDKPDTHPHDMREFGHHRNSERFR